MGISNARAHWEGGLKTGRGVMKPAHAAEAPFSLASRFEGQPSSNPEELIGAALAGCFSMALGANLERAGHAPERIETSAEVHLEKQGEAFSITRIALSSRAMVPGVEAAQLRAIADETKRTCPVSKALAGVDITLDAQLA
jgi:osmotically inducible protein OsmC